jgi:hypothetical protein
MRERGVQENRRFPTPLYNHVNIGLVYQEGDYAMLQYPGISGDI